MKGLWLIKRIFRCLLFVGFAVLTVLMSCSSDSGNSSATPLYFAATLGGENDEVIFVIEETTDGGYIYGGYTESSGAGDRDLLLVKTDETGLIEWQKTIGGSLIDDVQSILVLADGYIICGYTQSFGNGEYDVLVLKISLSGDIIWQKTYGGEKTEYGKSIKKTADGGYILVGYTGSFGEGAHDIWVIKLNKDGDIEWQKTYGESDVENSYSIIETSDDGYIVSGREHYLSDNRQQIYLIFKINLLGELEWKKLYGIGGNMATYSMAKTDDEGFIVAGYTDLLGTNSLDIILVKFDIFGNIQWQKAYSGSGDDLAYSVIKTSNGGYFLTGHSNSTEDGSYDIIAIMLDSAGNIRWQKAYGGSGDDISKSYRSVETENGDFVILGNTKSFNDNSGYDAIMLKVPSTGELLGISREIALTVSDINFTMTDSSILSNDSNATPSDSNLQFVDSNLSFSYQVTSEVGRQ
ncbi:MAG: hypothetical protein Q7J31_15355 [Syntrophales bacterium]|nr:hypothetical protein [Syntrophales bacterium]